ncbi:anaphase-promoting complex subunit 6 [Lucilia cuprina]|uniref:anaphase-promoting complex subunit 6 n=1 Tax=Lucilia cuprina TaxID=7375 RepID=UPI001F06CA5A|nr:anaphase-promoting complex subunit 6 [Lucilia cuprina]XP_046805020.1 anaphase-promoting complex subunit 6 [Lucilia cuprina]
MSQRKRNFYEILNVTSNATLEELKVNYKQLILQYHPDKLQQQQQQLENNLQKLEINNESNDKEFVAITEAWNCLKDPVKRKQYDAEELLNKFHTHNNIYAHIKLSEMKKQLNTGDYYLSEEDDDDDDDVDGEHSQKVEKEKEKTKYLYTYDCRCGGQYIVDESAEQYCGRADNNQHHDIQIKSNHNNNNNNGVGDDDDDADKSTQNNTKSSPNIEENKKNDGGSGGGGGNTADGSVEGVVFVQQHHNEGDEVAAEEVDDEVGELIVECSECSLVIILNG